jgi:hypothetical protein
MNPYVEAALIGGGAAVIAGGWTALVAVAAGRTTRTVTRHTIDASTANTIRALEAARSDRLWDKQAATYSDAITAIRWRQARRQRQFIAAGRGRMLADEKPPVEWWELQGRLFAFASPAVLLAFKTASDAGIRADGSWLELDLLVHEADTLDAEFDPVADSTPEMDRVREAARQAVQAANDKDDALIQAIRDDLHNEGGSALAQLVLDEHGPSGPASN